MQDNPKGANKDRARLSPLDEDVRDQWAVLREVLLLNPELATLDELVRELTAGSRDLLHRTEIGMVESGERLPRVDTLMKLAGALEVRPEALLQGIEWIAPAPSAGGSFLVGASSREGR
jgi:hypothetical protein